MSKLKAAVFFIVLVICIAFATVAIAELSFWGVTQFRNQAVVEKKFTTLNL